MRSSTLIHDMDNFGHDIRIVLKYLAIFEHNTVTFTIVDPNSKLLVENTVRMTDLGTFIIQSPVSDSDKNEGNGDETEGLQEDGNETEVTQDSLSLDVLKEIISYAKKTASTHPQFLTVWDEMWMEVKQYEVLYEE